MNCPKFEGEPGENGICLYIIDTGQFIDPTCTTTDQEEFSELHTAYHDGFFSDGINIPEEGPQRAGASWETIDASGCPLVNLILYDRARGGLHDNQVLYQASAPSAMADASI